MLKLFELILIILNAACTDSRLKLRTVSYEDRLMISPVDKDKSAATAAAVKSVKRRSHSKMW